MHKLFKNVWFYIGVAVALIIIIIAAIIFLPNGRTAARIHSVNGTVDVNTGSGYAPASADMLLRDKDSIRTGQNSTATVVLYESVIITIDPDSEMTIADLSKRSQAVTAKGSVWTKVAHLGGIEEYSISTPTTTATVRGTAFHIGDALIVIEGTVEADEQGYKGPVKAGEKLVNGTIMNLTAEDKALVVQELKHELDVLRELRLREVHKNGAAMSFVRATYHATDEDIERFFIDIDEGRQSEDVIRSNAPVLPPTADVVFAYDAEIKKTIAAITEYS